MILSADQVRRQMYDQSQPLKDRIVITPVLDWDRQAKAGSSAVDVRLGQRFRVPRRTKLDSLDHLSPQHAASIQRYKDDYHVVLGDHFVLHPRQFVLGETLEWIHLPSTFAAYVTGRSSWGRDGLIIATASGVHSGYYGILTLELTNLGEIPIRLYPGLTIAQLFIHRVDALSGVPPARSRFSVATAPESADAAGDEKAVIRRLRDLRGLTDPGTRHG
jgi:dCTP deaminase